MPSAVLSAYSSEMNKTEVLASRGLWSNRKDHSHSITVREAKGVWRRKFSLVWDLEKIAHILGPRNVSTSLVKDSHPATEVYCILSLLYISQSQKRL